MPRNIQKASELKGLFIYHDKHHGTVFYDILTRNGYILTSKDIKTYNLSIAFLPIAVIIFYFALQLKLNTTISLLIALGIYVVAELIYRFTFLYKLPCVEHYKITKENSIINNLTKTYSKQRLIVLAIFLLALVILMALYILTSDFSKIISILLWIVVGFSFVFFILVLIAIRNKK